MAEHVSYGSYTFPTPTPLVSLGVDTVYIGGVADHYSEEIGVVGTLTGQNLSGIHLQKMQMIVSEKLRNPADDKAEYSPNECPAKYSAFSKFILNSFLSKLYIV